MWVLISNYPNGYDESVFVKLYNDRERARIELNKMIEEYHLKYKLSALCITLEHNRIITSKFEKWADYKDDFDNYIKDSKEIKISMITDGNIHYSDMIFLSEEFEDDDSRNIKPAKR